MYIPGPSYPTPSELGVANLAKCDTAGQTSV